MDKNIIQKHGDDYYAHTIPLIKEYIHKVLILTLPHHLLNIFISVIIYSIVSVLFIPRDTTSLISGLVIYILILMILLGKEFFILISYILIVIPFSSIMYIFTFMIYVKNFITRSNKRMKLSVQFIDSIDKAFNIDRTNIFVSSALDVDNPAIELPIPRSEEFVEWRRNETRQIPTFMGDAWNSIPEYCPPFGYEYGFDNYGLRYNYNQMYSLMGKYEKYTIEGLAKFVYVGVWIDVENIENINIDKYANYNRLQYGNRAYIALYHPDEEIRSKYLKFLEDSNILIQ